MTSYADEQIADAARRKLREEQTGMGAPQIGSYQPKVVSVAAEAEAAKIQVGALPDSGKRAEFESGMVRDVEDDKVKYDLVLDGPMFERWAAHMTAGAEKYDERNWMKAEGNAEFQRFRRSALRHFIQWFQGAPSWTTVTDEEGNEVRLFEDHAAAVFFNVNGAEYVSDKMFPAGDWMAPVKAEPAFYCTTADVTDGGF